MRTLFFSVHVCTKQASLYSYPSFNFLSFLIAMFLCIIDDMIFNMEENRPHQVTPQRTAEEERKTSNRVHEYFNYLTSLREIYY